MLLRSSRLARCVFAALLALALSLVVGASEGRAGAYVGSYLTPGCEQAPVWKIGYRFYWSNDRGMTRPKADMPEAIESAREFADKVGLFSECGVRIWFDFYDEEEAVFSGGYNVPAGWEQGDSGAFADGRYDYAFYRAPDEATVSGVTNYRDAFFPIAPGDVAWSPWWGLQMHEWLHGVVNFYSRIQQGWPYKDVHGGCDRPDYIERDPGYGCMVLPSWFADMMTGRVAEGGAMKGILPPEWAYFGTPLNPLHVPQLERKPREPRLRQRRPKLRLQLAGEDAGKVRLRLTAPRLPPGRPARISVLLQQRFCGGQFAADRQRSASCHWRRLGSPRSRRLSLQPAQTISVRAPQSGQRLAVEVATRQFVAGEFRYAAARARILIRG